MDFPLQDFLLRQNFPDLNAVLLGEGAVVLLRKVDGDVGEVHGGVECGEGECGDAARLVEGRVVVHGQHAAQTVLPQDGQQRPLIYKFDEFGTASVEIMNYEAVEVVLLLKLNRAKKKSFCQVL